MTESEWEVIADRLEDAWPTPAMTSSRRAVYFDVLRDLDADAVREACGVLMREDREVLPAPGVIRRQAVGGARAMPEAGRSTPPLPTTDPVPAVTPASAALTRRPSGRTESRAVVVVFWVWLVLLLTSVVAVFARDSVLADDSGSAIDQGTWVEGIATVVAWCVIFFLVFGAWELAKWMRRKESE